MALNNEFRARVKPERRESLEGLMESAGNRLDVCGFFSKCRLALILG